MATIKQYTKKDGSKAWQFHTYLGISPMTGKEIRTTRRDFGTKKEAQLELNRLLVDFEKNGLQKEHNETFKEVFELWFESYATTVKEVTLLKNEIKFNKWILPVYGDLRIRAITVKHAQKIVNKWAKKTDQYRILHSTASRIFKYAINLGIIDRNPLERVLMPQREKTIKETIKVYSKDELKKLFTYVDGKEGTYRNEYDKALLRFLFYSGVRVSEALAMNWGDVDFENGSVLIDKTLSQTKHGYKITTPKTETSNAKLAMDETYHEDLKKMADQPKKVYVKPWHDKPPACFLWHL